MFNKIKRLFTRKTEQNEWYAEYKMEDGQTGRVYDIWSVYSVEQIAYNRGHKSLWFSVMGGDWFDSFKAPEN